MNIFFKFFQLSKQKGSYKLWKSILKILTLRFFSRDGSHIGFLNESILNEKLNDGKLINLRIIGPVI